MSAQSIIDKANAIILDAGGLAAGISWPTPANCLGGVTPVPTAFTAYEFWSSMKVYHERMMGDVRPGALLQIGTSITQGMDVAQTHPALLNFGIGGDTLRGVLNRLQGLAPLLARAGGLVLEIGVNDAGTEPMANMQLMYDRLFAWLTGPLVVVSLVPARGVGATPICSVETCNAVNQYMQAKCSGRPQTAYADITTPLRDTDGWIKPGLSIGDRIHPNAAGYGVIRPILQAAMQTVLA